MHKNESHSDQLYAIENEAQRADDKYGDFASMHEAYGVLAEEVDELFDLVKLKQGSSTYAHGSTRLTREQMIANEAIQVAAVALRIAEQAYRVTR